MSLTTLNYEHIFLCLSYIYLPNTGFNVLGT